MTIEQITNKIFDTSMSRQQMKKFLESEVLTKEETKELIFWSGNITWNDFGNWLKNKRKEK